MMAVYENALRSKIPCYITQRSLDIVSFTDKASLLAALEGGYKLTAMGENRTLTTIHETTDIDHIGYILSKLGYKLKKGATPTAISITEKAEYDELSRLQKVSLDVTVHYWTESVELHKFYLLNHSSPEQILGIESILDFCRLNFHKFTHGEAQLMRKLKEEVEADG